MTYEWEDVLQYSREKRKPLRDRTITPSEISDEWQQIVEAGIGPFEKAHRADKQNLSMAERHQITEGT